MAIATQGTASNYLQRALRPRSPAEAVATTSPRRTTMSDGAKPSFKHALAKKALAPVVTSVATAITAFLMRKAAELWQQKLQPKVEERGGAEAVARDAMDSVSNKVAPVTDA